MTKLRPSSQQKLSQIQGVGQVTVGGGALPSVRVDANPTQLASYGLTLANLQSVLSLQNSDLAKGQISDGIVTADILANDQISHADDYKPLIVGYNNGAAVRLSDVAAGHGLRAERPRRRLFERQARGYASSSSASPAPTSSTRSTASARNFRLSRRPFRSASIPPSFWIAPRPSAPRSVTSRGRC